MDIKTAKNANNRKSGPDNIRLIEKDAKKSKLFSKIKLTKGIPGGIIYKRFGERPTKRAVNEEQGILKTIQEQERKRQSNSESQNPRRRRKPGKGISGSKRSARIKHKSLILAQDERWRRA